MALAVAWKKGKLCLTAKSKWEATQGLETEQQL